ncbi:MAG: cAMP/cGMP-dependent 3',5'-cyclic-AMP/GMP phosphodiesterase [Spirochaetales bacterium]
MQQGRETSETVSRLPRGGTLVRTPAGAIQVGVPPETIKDTITTSESVPQTFVLPRELFNWSKGINVGDMEFPIYFNFFIRKQHVRVLCSADQAERLRTAIRESVFGPEDLDLTRDIFSAGDDVYVPDIRGELEFFRGSIALDDLLEIVMFDDEGRAQVDGVTVEHVGQSFRFEWDGREQVRVPDHVEYNDLRAIGQRLSAPFVPPRFGVTCLGPSHGFDPQDNTSGFIIWLNHCGIMVDPPVNATEWLTRSNVSPKIIDSIIITHAHADHDAGAFQKILEEGRINVYTTNTIMGSFLRKYSAFSGESPEFLQRLFSFHPVYVGRPFFLHGGEFQIYYSLHSIPTMAFRLQFQGKSLVYSSDHQADPAIHNDLLERGIIDRQRYDQLRSFAWDSDVIFHEAGIAPLHTPVSELQKLPAEIRNRMLLFHIAAKDMPTDGSLERATFGIENTIYFETDESAYEEAYRVLDVLKHLDFSNELSVTQIQQFLFMVEWRRYRQGEKIIEQGSKGTHFFVIVNGNAVVMAEDLVRGKKLGAYDYFGEVALLTTGVRTADIVAESDVEALTIEKSRFLNLISGTEFEGTLLRLISNRSEETWNVLAESETFAVLTDYQRMWLESVLEPDSVPGGTRIIAAGDTPDTFMIIRAGSAVVVDSGDGVQANRPLGRGDLIGDLQCLHRGTPMPYGVYAETELSVFRIDRAALDAFLSRNPGMAMRVPRPVTLP